MPKEMPKVVILGGGVAGMSAAHELAERGFRVSVYEARAIPGGKARSIRIKEAHVFPDGPDGTEPSYPIPSSQDGRKQLPGEHGLRFFPGFYQHVTDTMKRIPYFNNCQGVFDNLLGTEKIAITLFDHEDVILPAKTPLKLEDIQLMVKAVSIILGSQVQNFVKPEEFAFFAHKIWQLITSCKERRIGEYEKLSWWEYLEADRFSHGYQSLLARGLTESLVASKAKLASTKTVGDIFIQLILDIINPTQAADRVLNGPTNDVWLDPWLRYLEKLGVDYHFNSLVKSINCTDGKITSATITDLITDEIYDVTGDYYIAAVPIEVMSRLIITSELEKYDPSLSNIHELGRNIAWMNGIQFYLTEKVPIVYGHVLYVDTPWALTSISQQQFWADFNLREYGDGTVKDVLSVVVSDWGPFMKPTTEEQRREAELESQGIKIKKYAENCTDDEIAREVWEELKRSLNQGGNEILKDEYLHSWHLDPDIVDPETELLQWITNPDVQQVTLEEATQHLRESRGKTTAIAEDTTKNWHRDRREAEATLKSLIALGYIEKITTETGETKYESKFDVNNKINLEPLLVNLVNTWQLRPDAFTKIPNLFLASDYVRTNTDLATMEGANEAARRAVNSIISASGVKTCLCRIWDLHEPELFAPFRLHDRWRYSMGLPWDNSILDEKFFLLKK